MDRSRRRLLSIATGVCPLAGFMACGDSRGSGSVPAPIATPSMLPAVGAHTIATVTIGPSIPTLTSAPMQTHAAGSMLLVGVGRGHITAHGAPSDNKGNVFAQVGTTHAYRNWPKSGTALYVGAPVSGGAGHVVTAAKPAPTDETTVSVVEVLNARRIQDLQWNEVPAGRPLTSQRVRATGPALLVAWWWGDADARVPQTAVPDNGFVPIHAVLLAGNYVQCAVATRQVAQAGTYDLTWTATPSQGAQLWIAAIQAD